MNEKYREGGVTKAIGAATERDLALPVTANKSVEIGAARVGMSPVGLALYAEEFFIAGNAIPEDSRARGNSTFTPVPYYLICRSLELMLKAFLITESWSIDTLKKKKYGHNLVVLWNTAKKEGLLDVLGTTGLHFESDIERANAYYHDKAFEYFDFRRWAHGYDDLPPLDRFRDETKKIIEKTKQYCFSVS